jgi:DNA-binding transcriptional ArsR family regulator
LSSREKPRYEEEFDQPVPLCFAPLDYRNSNRPERTALVRVNPIETARKLRKRSVEDAVAYAVAHRIRVEILGYLHEGPRSPTKLADLMGYPLSTIEHHIKEMLASGSIELARVEQVRNTNEHFYRAVELPFFSDEEMSAMPEEARQEIYGLILQSSMAEAQAAFRAGKMSSDPRVWMAWRWFNLDACGRNDLADELARSWARIQEIEVESTGRRTKSGEEAVSIVVSIMGFERCRTSHTPPATQAIGKVDQTGTGEIPGGS